MALFTDAPARRLPYHLDGSQVNWIFNNGTTKTATQTQLNYINDIDNIYDGVTLGTGDNITTPGVITIGVCFPIAYNISNYFIYTPTQNNYTYTNEVCTLTAVKVSTDTTNGINGTWTTLTTPSPNGLLSKHTTGYNLSATEWFDSSYVSGTLINATSVKGIKFEFSYSGSTGGAASNTYNLNCLNFWGNINDPSATARLDFTDNAGVSLTKDVFYKTKKGQTDVKDFYLKNLHTAPTTKIDFTVDGEVTTVNSNITISVDGGTTYNALPYTWTTALASNAVSSVVKVKYAVSSTETLGLKYCNIQAMPTY